MKFSTMLFSSYVITDLFSLTINNTCFLASVARVTDKLDNGEVTCTKLSGMIFLNYKERANHIQSPAKL